jgi:hypothetical protein
MVFLHFGDYFYVLGLVFEMMLKLHNGKSWKEAIDSTIPKRKLEKPKKQDPDLEPILSSISPT